MAATRGAGVQTVEEIQLQAIARTSSPRTSPTPRASPVSPEVGDIDILVNNAGFAVWGSTETFEVASFDAIFAANVRAPFFLVADSRQDGGAWDGSIINISSNGRPPRSYGRRGVRGDQSGSGFIHAGMGGGVQPARHPVNAVAPGRSTHAPRRGNSSTRSDRHGHEACGRTPGDAEVVAFLASPRASY